MEVLSGIYRSYSSGAGWALGLQMSPNNGRLLNRNVVIVPAMDYTCICIRNGGDVENRRHHLHAMLTLTRNAINNNRGKGSLINTGYAQRIANFKNEQTEMQVINHINNGSA